MTHRPRPLIRLRSLPRHTARLRFTLLAGALFLLSGAAVLAITYLLFANSGQNSAGGPASGRGRLPGTLGQGPIGHQPIRVPAAQGAQAAQAAQLAADRHDLLVDLAIALVVVAVLALLAGWFFSGRMLRPVKTITATARRISATNLHQRLALDHADEEFKDLGDTLDDLFARLQAAFDAQRHFVANASHELRSPLTRERTLLQVALEEPSLDLWQTTGQQLLATNREQARLIDALLALARSEGGIDHHERIDLAALFDDLLLGRREDVKRLGLHVETTTQPAVLDGDPRLIERLIENLVDNAVKYNVTGGYIQVSTVFADSRASLSVTNTGPPIPPSDIDRLFQPFQRLDPRRTHRNDSHGLGLSIVRAIVTAHNGTVTAKPAPGGGLSVEVRFPPCSHPLNNGNGPVGSSQQATVSRTSVTSPHH